MYSEGLAGWFIPLSALIVPFLTSALSLDSASRLESRSIRNSVCRDARIGLKCLQDLRGFDQSSEEDTLLEPLIVSVALSYADR